MATENHDELDFSNEEEEGTVNPCPPQGLDNSENALLRGDAIGDTAYSHRWVLRCFYNITQSLPKYLDGLSSEDDVKISFAENHNVEEDEKRIVELDSSVEDASCQLWDMTVERDVALHILNIEEVDILQLANLIFGHSRAPRLTEVMVGVIANICCQEEGCVRVLGERNEDILGTVLSLFSSTSDVPSLCEILRLLHLLLWHRTNRTPKSTWASCPLLKALCQEDARNTIAFILANSLSDNLINSLLTLLSSLLFVCLPETGLYVASLFSQKEIVSGITDILRRKSRYEEDCALETIDPAVHKSIFCLYAFIDTPGAALFEKVMKEEPVLESVLIQYIEHEGRATYPEDLVGETAERLCCSIGLCQLIIPFMKLPSIVMTIGRLLALINGQTHQYTVDRSTSREDILTRTISNEGNTLSALSELCESKLPEKIRRESKEDDTELEALNQHFGLSDYKTEKQETNSENEQTPSVDYNDEKKNYLFGEGSTPNHNVQCGWLSPPLSQVDMSMTVNPSKSTSTASRDPVNSGGVAKTETTNKSHGPGEYNTAPPTEPQLETSNGDLTDSLSNLKQSLEEYCFHLLSWWWSARNERQRRPKNKLNWSFQQHTILKVLDQCHAHEVIFILDSVRKKDPLLVPRLQEQLLDSGRHQRLVAMLAHMYQ